MPWLYVHVLQPLVVESEVVEIDLADAPLEEKVVASTHRHQVWLDDQRPIGCYCILEQTVEFKAAVAKAMACPGSMSGVDL